MSIAEDNRTTELATRREHISPRQALALVLIACVPLYFWGLGHPPLFDPDEPVYAETGRTMLRSHAFAGWWSPHYNGHLWFDKPPLTYWLIAISMKAFGENAFAARFPMALCALLLAAATGCLADRLFPQIRRAGVWSAVVIATCLESTNLARAAVTDMILVLFLTLAVWGLWTWLDDPRKPAALLGAGAATGLAVLTKGPVAIVLIGGLAVFYLLAARQAARLLAPSLWLALLLALAISLPWYLSMARLHGALFVRGFLEANNLTRYVSAEHATTSSPLFFLPVLIGFLFPWTGAFAAAIPGAVRRVRDGDRAALFAVIWIVWVFLFFTLSQTKLVTYIYPLYPLVAVLVGAWIAAGPTRGGTLTHVIVFSVMMSGVAALLPSLVRHPLPTAAGTAILLGILLGLTVAGTLLAWAMAQRRKSAAWDAAVYGIPAAAMIVLFVTLASARFWDKPVPRVSQTELAAVIKRQTRPGDVVRAMTLERPSLVFYSERNFVFTDSRPVTAAAMARPPYPFCATENKYLPELAADLPPGGLRIVSHSGPDFVLLRYQPPGMTTAH